MALSDSEIARVKYELGYNLLTISAEPYIGVARVFELVIQPNLLAGAITTSTTAVTAVDPGLSPAPVNLTLGSASGFTAGDRVVVDVDDRQETPVIQNVSGSTITVLLALDHTGTYQVTVERGESIVREHLRYLRDIAKRLGELMPIQVGVSKADDVDIAVGLDSPVAELKKLQMYWRDELSSALGVENLRKSKRSGSVALY
jgi:hypothetical protein